MINELTHRTHRSHCNSPNPQDDCWKVNCDGCPYRLPRFVRRLRQAFPLIVSILLVTACIGHDPYAIKFPQIGLGDNRARVIDVMGQPHSINSAEMPMLKAEQLAWRAPNKGRVYIVLIVLDHAAAKFAVD